MSVRDTSIAAYHDHVDSGGLSRQKRKLLDAIRDGQDYSRTELSEATGIRINSVCGAVFELVEKGFLVDGPKRLCRITGKKVRPVARPTRAAPDGDE